MTQPNFDPSFTTRPELSGSFGMAASTHWLASAAAMGILEQGGNAFDAAVAGGFVLQIVEPHLNGPAGEVPILIHDAESGKSEMICGQGPAPAAATIDHFKGIGLDLIPGTGLTAACIPAAFDAWMLLLAERGTMDVASVMAPAIHYARQGFPAMPQITSPIAKMSEVFKTHWPSSADTYLQKGEVPKTGSMMTNPVLADTYQRLVDEAMTASGRDAQIAKARDIWRQGFIAEAIDSFCKTTEAMDGTGQANRALLTGHDMAGFSASVEAPLAYDYHGYTVLKGDAWTQGPAMLQSLALLKGFDLAAMDPYGADFAHAVIEAQKLAFADRDAWYTDPAYEHVPTETLLSDAYNDDRRKLIDNASASHDWRPGQPDGRELKIADWIKNPPATMPTDGFGGGEPTREKSGDRILEAPATRPLRGDTCHLDVIDRWGNMVAATPSGGWLMASPVIPALGFPLGTRMQMFWLEPGLPCSLVPGKRPRTTLSPSMALKDGAPYLAFGTPGGDQQEQWPLSVFLRHVHHGLNLQQAIDAPCFHTEHLVASFWPRPFKPGVMCLEDRYHEDVIAELQRRGHHITMTGDWSLGRVSACSQEISNGQRILRAAANPRGMQGYAVGR
ncbi:MAG: gamma-glutamyltransferase family protein [Alphaproteobacteria bacterium]|nr:gamma-glutamyltransferase family protein [Alphaproteobacteria bacterium SS10]